MTTLPPLGHRLEMAFRGRDCPTVWVPERVYGIGPTEPFRALRNTGQAAIVAFRFSSVRTSLLYAQYAGKFEETSDHIIRIGNRRVELGRVPNNLLFESSLNVPGTKFKTVERLETEPTLEDELYRLPITAGFNQNYIGPFYPEDREGYFDLLGPTEYHPYRSSVEIQA